MANWSGLMLVAGLYCRGDDVLLVRERDPEGNMKWGLPGGRVEGPELLPVALTREFREETGLAILKVGRLRLLSQHHQEGRPGTAALHVFDVLDAEGELAPQDPDGLIEEARFVGRREATDLVNRGQFAPAEAPIAHLLLAGPQDLRTPAWFWELSEDSTAPVVHLDGSTA